MILVILKREAHEFLYKTSLERWTETHTLNYSFAVDEGDEDQKVLAIGVGEIKACIEQWERSMEYMKLPEGMGEFDTAAFTDRYHRKMECIRQLIRAHYTVKERIKINCLNYAIKIEKTTPKPEKIRILTT